MTSDKTIFGIMGRLVNAVTFNQPTINDPELKEAVKEAEVILEDQKIASGPGEERRDIEASVTRIIVNGGGIKLTLKQGFTPSLVVSCADGKHLRKVLTSISGNALSISVEPTVLVLGNIHNYGDVSFGASGLQGGISQIAKTITNHGSVYFGTGPSRKGRVSIQGSRNVVQTFHGGITGNVIAGDMIVNGEGSDSTISIGSIGVLADVTVELPNIQEIDIRGSASLQFRDFSQDEIALGISGSSDVVLSGVVGNLDVGISGSGSVDAATLTAKTAKLNVSGSGDIHANVLEKIKARISGSGRVTISGNPPARDTNVSGSGKVKFV